MNMNMNIKYKLLLSAAILASTVGIAIAQNTPSVVSPPQLSLTTNAVTSGLIWTPTEWNTSFSQKKDVLVFYATTSGAAAVTLTTDGAAASSANVGSIPSGVAVEYSAQCLILNQTTKAANTYTVAASAISNIAGTVAVSGTNPAVVAGPVLGGGMALAAAVTIVADNVNKGWQINYTPPVANVQPIISKCTVEVLVLQ
jgi:hypothetical protein